MNEPFGISNMIPYKQYSETEYQLLLSRLWSLLAVQTGKYTMGDSTSVTVETAQDLLCSLWYTLMLTMEESGLSYDRLLTDDLLPLVKQGQALLMRKVEQAKQLWNAVCQTAPAIPNSFYWEAIQGVESFFQYYDIYFFAHQRPLDFSYPLINQPPDSLHGISYVEVYLQNLLEENILMNQFDHKLVVRLLESTVPDYQELYLNLCEQPLINAFGRAILGKSILSLDISEQERLQIMASLAGMGTEEMRAYFCVIIDSLCDKLNKKDAFTRTYLAELSNELASRLVAAASAGDLSRIFITMLPENLIVARL